MPFHRPIPESKRRGNAGGELQDENRGGTSLLGAWVQAEKVMQIALMLPDGSLKKGRLSEFRDASANERAGISPA